MEKEEESWVFKDPVYAGASALNDIQIRPIFLIYLSPNFSCFKSQGHSLSCCFPNNSPPERLQMFQQQHALLEEGSQQASRLPLLWLCCSPCCAKSLSTAVDFTYFHSNIHAVGWASLDGKDWLSSKGQSVTSNKQVLMCAPSGSSGKPWKAHSSHPSVCPQFCLSPSPAAGPHLPCCHPLQLNSISPPISCAPDCLQIPPKEPHIPSSWPGADAEISNLFHHQPQPLSMLTHCSEERGYLLPA